jgi:hypothetical protein
MFAAVIKVYIKGKIKRGIGPGKRHGERFVVSDDGKIQ